MAAATAMTSCVMVESGSRIVGMGRIPFQVSQSALAIRRVGLVSTRPLECLSATKQKGSPILYADDDDDEVAEFGTVDEWMKNKPAGFGHKEYDTSLEDKLLAEIEADKKAQTAAALAKKASKNSVKAKENAAAAPPQEGVEVCVRSLPKKKNIERDLRASLNKSSVQGLLHIRPIVQGNEKTREPVCKGMAFLTFATDDDAENFVERFNGEMVKFGKVEKKLVCELALVNSCLKKQVPQNGGTRLPVRERVPQTLVPSSSSSSSAVELVDTEDLGDGHVVLDVDSTKEQDDNLESLELSDEELLKLEEEVWAELEDEDDFELDRELEDDIDGLNIDSTLDESGGSDDTDQSSEELVEFSIQTANHGQLSNEEELKEGRDEVEEDEGEEGNEDVANKIELQEAGTGQGFGRVYNKSDATAEDKDRRIQKLESKLQELQLLLKKRNSAEFTKETEGREQESKKRIEALEKRVLGKVKTALLKDSKPKNLSKRLTSKKTISSKNKDLSKGNPSKTKTQSLGSGSRLKKKERKIYMEVLSKYSSATEVAKAL